MIMIGIGNTLEFKITCTETDKEFNVDIIISDIISKINSIDINNMEIPLDAENYIVVSTPSEIFGDESNYIKQLYINNQLFNMVELSTDERDVVIEQLPYNVFDRIHNMFHHIYKQCDEIVYFEYRSPHVPDSKPIQFTFNLYDSTFFDFIKTLLRDDLLSYYKMYYSLTAKFKFDITYLQDITPAETKMYMSFIREDLQERKEQVNEATSKIPNIKMPQDPGG